MVIHQLLDCSNLMSLLFLVLSAKLRYVSLSHETEYFNNFPIKLTEIYDNLYDNCFHIGEKSCE